MEVNQHELGTCLVVFCDQDCRITADEVSTYRGDVIPFKEWCRCLLVVLHATKKAHVAATALYASGSKAMHCDMHAILRRCRHRSITQFDFKCRIPVLLV
jgi:hypothetical protein